MGEQFGGSAAPLNRCSSYVRVGSLARRIMETYGVTDSDTAAEFLYPRMSAMHSPFYLNDMEPAVLRIRRAVENKEIITLFSDSDLDGLTSLAVMVCALEGTGVKVVTRYPVDKESYGLTTGVIDEIVETKSSLLITLDCGVRDIAEIAYARKKGIDVIVCDHHEQAESLPDALVVNPKRADSTYPFHDLAGAGVAFKLAHAFASTYLPFFGRTYALAVKEEDSPAVIRFYRNGVFLFERSPNSCYDQTVKNLSVHTIFHFNMPIVPAEFEGIAENIAPFEEQIQLHGWQVLSSARNTLSEAIGLNAENHVSTFDLAEELFTSMCFLRPKKLGAFVRRIMPFASIGTIADMVPLLGENRIIVKEGFRNADTTHPVIGILAKECGGEFSAKGIAWRVGPLLNAPGRLGKTHVTADFLLSTADESCSTQFSAIRKINEERKKILKERTAECLEQISADVKPDTRNLIYVKSDKIGEGFTGLIATRLAESAGKPAVVLSLENGISCAKGSARSPSGFDFLSVAEPFVGSFARFGGHAFAFGFTADVDAVDSAIKKIDNAMEGVSVTANKKLSGFDVGNLGELADYVKRDKDILEPFGNSFPEPVFSSIQCVTGYSSFGNDKKHGKFTFDGGVQAIGWNMAVEMEKIPVGGTVSIVFNAEIDPYNGRVRLVLENFQPVLTDGL